jgi:hypothetical protein
MAHVVLGLSSAQEIVGPDNYNLHSRSFMLLAEILQTRGCATLPGK